MATKKRTGEQEEMSGSPASLVALPNELLSIILQQIDENDRLSIAYVCRRLNDFVASLSLGRFNKYLQSYSNLWICSGHHTTCPSIVCLKDLCPWVVNPPRIPVMNIKFSDNYLGQLRLLTHYIERFPESQRPIVHVHVGYQNRWSDMKADSQVKKLNTFLTRLAELKCVASFLTPYNNKKAALLDTAKRKNNQRLFNPPPLTTLATAFIDPTSDVVVDWHIRSANASPVEKLSILIKSTRRFPQIDVSLLSLPKLRHLEVEGSSMRKSDLSHFLSRHSSLESITFGWNVQLRGGQSLSKLPPQALHSLISISADAGLLLGLLPDLAECENLQRVRLNFSMSCERRGSNGADCRDIFTWIAQRQTIHYVSFPMGSLKDDEWESLTDGTICLPQVTRLGCHPHISYNPVPRKSGLVALFPNIEEYEMPHYQKGAAENTQLIWPSLKRMIFGSDARVL